MISPNDPTESAPIPFPATSSRLFLIDDGDARWWYAATDRNHAISQFVEDIWGGPVEDFLAECPEITVTEMPDDYSLTICLERGCTDEEDHDVAMTAREWCEWCGGSGCVGTTMDL